MSNWWNPASWNMFKVPTPANYSRQGFKKPLSELPPGAVILCASGDYHDYLGWLIGFFSAKSGYRGARRSHAEWLLSVGKLETVSADGAKGKVVITTLKSRIGKSSQMLYVFGNHNLTVDGLVQEKAAALASIGLPYDYAGVGGYVLGSHPDTPGVRYCSENCVRIVRAWLPFFFGTRSADSISPEDLYEYFLAHPEEGWYLWDTQNVTKPETKEG